MTDIEVDFSINDTVDEKIGVVTAKANAPTGQPRYLISLSFDELDDLVAFIEDNALDDERNVLAIKDHLVKKLAMIEARPSL